MNLMIFTLRTRGGRGLYEESIRRGRVTHCSGKWVNNPVSGNVDRECVLIFGRFRLVRSGTGNEDGYRFSRSVERLYVGELMKIRTKRK